MIDHEGYRANVGIIIVNDIGEVFWGKRAGQSSWQFPQGGINAGESPEQALYRELEEETGLAAHHVKMIGRTDQWLRYQLPERYIRRRRNQRGPVCIGQKQLWYLLQLPKENEQQVRFDSTSKPEFDGWRWINYQQPAQEVVYFKQDVYRRAMCELAHLVHSNAQDIIDAINTENTAVHTHTKTRVCDHQIIHHTQTVEPNSADAGTDNHAPSNHASSGKKADQRSGLRYLRRHLRR